jgi:DNA-binding transcriptional ArsR family regulator
MFSTHHKVRLFHTFVKAVEHQKLVKTNRDPGGSRVAEENPGDNAKRDEEAVHRFVEHMALTMARFGFPRMPGRVLFTLLTAEEEGLTAGEIGKRLGVSPAAISGAVRYLMQVGLIIREPVRGSRRDRYRAPDNPWYEATVGRGHVYQEIADLASTGVDALGGPGTVSGARVAEMVDFFRFMQAEMADIYDHWRSSRLGRTRDDAAG